MNFIDKAIESVAPCAAVKRMHARQRLKILNSGYGQSGASRTKRSMRDFTAPGGDARRDVDIYADILRRRSRELYMGGSAIATSAIKTMRTNVVGRGLKLKPKIDFEAAGITAERAEATEKEIQREFKLWADTKACDIRRQSTFTEMQQLAFMNWLLSGDCAALFVRTKRAGEPYDLRVRIIEADRISNPDMKSDTEKMASGVEFNDADEVCAYYISSAHPYGDGAARRRWTRVEAFGKETGRPNVLHIANYERIGQVRGTPFLAPVIEDIKMIGRYTDAELSAAVAAGYFTVFIEKSESANGKPIGEAEDDIGQDDQTIELGPGSVWDLGEGEHANAVAPGRPNTAFDGFVSSMAMQIGAALEIPAEILLKKFDATYSASRGALLEAWKAFKMYREWLSADFCQPIYEEWLCEAVAKGRIAAPGFWKDKRIQKAYMGAEWNGPAQGLLNPLQEVNAAVIRMQNGLSTHERESMEINGSDFRRNAEMLAEEMKLLTAEEERKTEE